MHIPDGFLSAPVWFSLDAFSLPALAWVARRAQRNFEQSRVPLLGVMGAFVFAAEMINFPVGVGTSGHLVGGALLAIALGPAPAAVVMTAILAVQAFVFQDGGVLALGANVFNMALAGVLAGWLPYQLWGGGRWWKLSIFLAGACSVAVSATLAMSELLISGIAIPRGVLGISVLLFGVLAALEGTITLAVVRGIEALNPAFITKPSFNRSCALKALGAAAALLAGAGVLISSRRPDGVERVLHYQANLLATPWIQKAGTGLLGVALISAVCVLLGRAISRQRSA